MKSAVMTFGRMNPPTRGHLKLIERMKEENGFVWVFLSSRQDADRNPLSHEEKSSILRNYVQMNDVDIGPSHCTNIFQALKYLDSLDYKRVTICAGSDRAGEFQGKFDQYIGKDFNFEEIIIKSAGDRSDDNFSSTRAREAVKSGNFNQYCAITHDLRGYSIIRKRYGMTEFTPGSRVWIELNNGISFRAEVKNWKVTDQGALVFLSDGSHVGFDKLCSIEMEYESV